MQQYSRGGDIDEETQFPPDFAASKAYDKATASEEPMIEQQSNLASATPYMLSGSPRESVYDKLYQFNMTFIASILLAIILTCIAMTSVPLISLEVNHQARTVHYLPFYSSTSMFAILAFAIIGTFMIIKNIVNYVRFGVGSQNDYYTPHDTLKVGSLLLTVIAGELLFGGLACLFFVF